MIFKSLAMKKKVFFVVSHLGAGGSERVFWILSKYFDKTAFDVSLVLLDSRNPFFPINLENVNLINLNTIKASASFFKLCKLIKEEQPEAIFSTGGHINTLLSFVSLFVRIPLLIGRESSVSDLMARLGGIKEKFWDLFVPFTYKRVNIAICQSLEIKYTMANHYRIDKNKLVVIHNPVLTTNLIAKEEQGSDTKKIIIVARLAVEKGILCFLDVMKKLPVTYSLTIVGQGPLEKEIRSKIEKLKLTDRVELKGLVKNVPELISQHHLMVLPSIAEGFPNVVLESFSVGVPVVAFRVSGINELLRHDFNGYIIDLGDLQSFERAILKACNKHWDRESIKNDVDKRFGVKKIVKQYENLLASYNSLCFK